MDKNYTVYMHISPNKKRYIGITSQKVTDRWRNGAGYKDNTYFYRAIQKYGWENFEHIILYSNVTKEFACSKEIELIAKYNTTNSKNGYNNAFGGQLGTHGMIISKETRQKIREANKCYVRTPEQESNYRKAMEKLKGKPHSSEHNRKVSEALKGKYVRENSSAYGKKWTLERRKKLSETNKGHKVSENVYKKSVPAMHTAEARRKAKETRAKHNFTKENNAFYGKHHSVETKEILRLKSKESSKDRIWVTNENLKENHWIKSYDLQKYLDNGYVRGRRKYDIEKCDN